MNFPATLFAGLTKSTCDMKDYKHVTAMADYALRIREQLASVNEHSFNNFRLRVGINIGPVTSINFRLAFTTFTKPPYLTRTSRKEDKIQFGIWWGINSIVKKLKNFKLEIEVLKHFPFSSQFSDIRKTCDFLSSLCRKSKKNLHYLFIGI